MESGVWTPDELERYADEFMKHEVLHRPPHSLGRLEKVQRAAALLSVQRAVEGAGAGVGAGAGAACLLAARRLLARFRRHALNELKQRIRKCFERGEHPQAALDASPSWLQRVDTVLDLLPRAIKEMEQHSRRTVVRPPTNQVEVFVDRMVSELRAAWTRGLRGNDVLLQAAAVLQRTPAQLDSLWDSYRSVLVLKLQLQFAAGDRVGGEPAGGGVGFTRAEWRAVDTMLLYDIRDLQLVPRECLSSLEQLRALTVLLQLAHAQRLHQRRPHDAWPAILHAYAARGRTTSAVVLQRRWHELWRQARGPTPTPLHRALVRCFPPAPAAPAAPAAPPAPAAPAAVAWADLVAGGHVYEEPYEEPEAEPELVRQPADDNDDVHIIENNIETIEVDESSDSEITDNTVVSLDSEHREALSTERKGMCDKLQNNLYTQLKIVEVYSQVLYVEDTNICVDLTAIDSTINDVECHETTLPQGSRANDDDIQIIKDDFECQIVEDHITEDKSENIDTEKSSLDLLHTLDPRRLSKMIIFEDDDGDDDVSSTFDDVHSDTVDEPPDESTNFNYQLSDEEIQDKENDGSQDETTNLTKTGDDLNNQTKSYNALDSRTHSAIENQRNNDDSHQTDVDKNTDDSNAQTDPVSSKSSTKTIDDKENHTNTKLTNASENSDNDWNHRTEDTELNHQTDEAADDLNDKTDEFNVNTVDHDSSDSDALYIDETNKSNSARSSLSNEDDHMYSILTESDITHPSTSATSSIIFHRAFTEISIVDQTMKQTETEDKADKPIHGTVKEKSDDGKFYNTCDTSKAQVIKDIGHNIDAIKRLNKTIIEINKQLYNLNVKETDVVASSVIKEPFKMNTNEAISNDSVNNVPADVYNPETKDVTEKSKHGQLVETTEKQNATKVTEKNLQSVDDKEPNTGCELDPKLDQNTMKLNKSRQCRTYIKANKRKNTVNQCKSSPFETAKRFKQDNTAHLTSDLNHEKTMTIKPFLPNTTNKPNLSVVKNTSQVRRETDGSKESTNEPSNVGPEPIGPSQPTNVTPEIIDESIMDTVMYETTLNEINQESTNEPSNVGPEPIGPSQPTNVTPEIIDESIMDTVMYETTLNEINQFICWTSDEPAGNTEPMVKQEVYHGGFSGPSSTEAIYEIEVVTTIDEEPQDLASDPEPINDQIYAGTGSEKGNIAGYLEDPTLFQISEDQPLLRLRAGFERKLTPNDAQEPSSNPEQGITLTKHGDFFFHSQSHCELMRLCSPMSVHLERLPNSIMERLLEDFEGRELKRVKLPDIDEIRRINRRMLTAQVAPITATELDGEETWSDACGQRTPGSVLDDSGVGSATVDESSMQSLSNIIAELDVEVRSSDACGQRTLEPVLDDSGVSSATVDESSMQSLSQITRTPNIIADLDGEVRSSDAGFQQTPAPVLDDGGVVSAMADESSLQSLAQITRTLNMIANPTGAAVPRGRQAAEGAEGAGGAGGAGGGARRYCCLARRHGAVNAARRRIHARAGRAARADVPIHSHAPCSCCCKHLLAGRSVEERVHALLQRAAEEAQRNDKASSQPAKRNVESKRLKKYKYPRAKTKPGGAPPAEPEKEKDDYKEWIRQRNLTTKYFHIENLKHPLNNTNTNGVKETAQGQQNVKLFRRTTPEETIESSITKMPVNPRAQNTPVVAGQATQTPATHTVTQTIDKVARSKPFQTQPINQTGNQTIWANQTSFVDQTKTVNQLVGNVEKLLWRQLPTVNLVAPPTQVTGSNQSSSNLPQPGMNRIVYLNQAVAAYQPSDTLMNRNQKCLNQTYNNTTYSKQVPTSNNQPLYINRTATNPSDMHQVAPPNQLVFVRPSFASLSAQTVVQPVGDPSCRNTMDTPMQERQSTQIFLVNKSQVSIQSNKICQRDQSQQVSQKELGAMNSGKQQCQINQPNQQKTEKRNNQQNVQKNQSKQPSKHNKSNEQCLLKRDNQQHVPEIQPSQDNQHIQPNTTDSVMPNTSPSETMNKATYVLNMNRQPHDPIFVNHDFKNTANHFVQIVNFTPSTSPTVPALHTAPAKHTDQSTGAAQSACQSNQEQNEVTPKKIHMEQNVTDIVTMAGSYVIAHQVPNLTGDAPTDDAERIIKLNIIQTNPRISPSKVSSQIPTQPQIYDNSLRILNMNTEGGLPENGANSSKMSPNTILSKNPNRSPNSAVPQSSNMSLNSPVPQNYDMSKNSSIPQTCNMSHNSALPQNSDMLLICAVPQNPPMLPTLVPQNVSSLPSNATVQKPLPSLHPLPELTTLQKLLSLNSTTISKKSPAPSEPTSTPNTKPRNNTAMLTLAAVAENHLKLSQESSPVTQNRSSLLLQKLPAAILQSSTVLQKSPTVAQKSTAAQINPGPSKELQNPAIAHKEQTTIYNSGGAAGGQGGQGGRADKSGPVLPPGWRVVHDLPGMPPVPELVSPKKPVAPRVYSALGSSASGSPAPGTPSPGPAAPGPSPPGPVASESLALGLTAPGPSTLGPSALGPEASNQPCPLAAAAITTKPPVTVAEYVRGRDPTTVVLLKVDSTRPLLWLPDDTLLLADLDLQYTSPTYWTTDKEDPSRRILLDKERLEEQEHFPDAMSWLKVKPFAHMPSVDNALPPSAVTGERAGPAGGTATGVGSDLKPPVRIMADQKMYLKLTDQPLIYAQVCSVVSDAATARRLAELGAALRLYRAPAGLTRTEPAGELLARLQAHEAAATAPASPAPAPTVTPHRRAHTTCKHTNTTTR